MTTSLPQPDYDARWKTLIKALHRRFIKRFFPALYDLIDWTVEVRFLDKELLKLLADFNKKGVRQGDVLMQFQLKSGKEQLVFIHAEAQHIFDIKLPERMFVSFYRLRDQHPGVPVAALALYTGSEIPLLYNKYMYEFDETKLEYTFKAHLVKNEDPDALQISDNPIDLALLAAWYLLDSKGDIPKAALYKRKLAKLCFSRGFTKEEISILLTFVSFLIALPESEEIKYKEELMETLEEREVPLIEELPWLAEFLMHKFVLGKPLSVRDQERDRERDRERNSKLVIKHHLLGTKPKMIANLLEIDVKFVNSVIRQYRIAQKKKPKPVDN